MKNLYHDFRYEIDDYMYPLMEKWARPIWYENDIVGFLMVIDGYIEGLYVRKDLRRKGLGRQAVEDYIRDNGLPWRLHIINTNKVAKRFWNSLFVLKKIEVNDIDTLYEVMRVRE